MTSTPVPEGYVVKEGRVVKAQLPPGYEHFEQAAAHADEIK